MKHRSIHIFILVAAALVAAPQASQELSSWRDAVGRRVKTEIFNAFLSLQAGDAARPAAAPQGHENLLASKCEPAAGEARRERRERPSTRVEVHARREVPADVAMLGDPSDLELAQLGPEPPPADAKPAPAYRFELFDEKVIRGTALAMLTSPDVEMAQSRSAIREAATRARVAAQRRKAEEVKQQRVALSVQLDDADVPESLPDVELPGGLEALRQFEVDVNLFAPPARTKAPKAKRAPRPAPAPPAARRQCPNRRTTQLACGTSGPELFFISE